MFRRSSFGVCFFFVGSSLGCGVESWVVSSIGQNDTNARTDASRYDDDADDEHIRESTISIDALVLAL